MRWVVFLCFCSFSTAALALDDCNAKFPNMGQLDDRLKCLQSNNNGLQSQNALKAEMAGSSDKLATAKPATTPIANPEGKPNKPHGTTPQPLTRADCQKAGMRWNANANVYAGKQAIAKPETKPIAKPLTKPNKPHAIMAQPLTRADCKKAGMQWNSNANACGGSSRPSKRWPVQRISG